MDMEHATERRQSTRVGTMENLIVLEWQESTGTHSWEGQIVNMSERGALVVSDLPVPSSGRVFIQMKYPVKTDRTEARVVRRGRSNELGIEFPDADQWDLKFAATLGIDFSGLFGLSYTSPLMLSGS